MKRYVALIATVFMTGCSMSNTDEFTEIDFGNLEEKTFSDFPEDVLMGIQYIPISASSVDYLFSTPDNVKLKGNRLYVNDWMNRKLFTYTMDGEPVSVLYKRGRGVGEYLQISDFDVDDKGDIWVIDGQADYLFHYGADGIFVESHKLTFEADYIKCSGEERLLFAIAPWDESNYKDYQLMMTDNKLNVINLFAERRHQSDSDFELVPCAGIHSSGQRFFFHKPICDDAYCIDFSDKSEEIFHFDFGDKTVPEYARVDTESYMDEFEDYTTLGSAVYYDDELIAGGLVDEMQMKSFVIDRETNLKYIQDDAFATMIMLGISEGKIIYLLMPEAADELPFLPDEIKTHIKEEGVAFAVLPLSIL